MMTMVMTMTMITKSTMTNTTTDFDFCLAGKFFFKLLQVKPGSSNWTQRITVTNGTNNIGINNNVDNLTFKFKMWLIPDIRYKS